MHDETIPHFPLAEIKQSVMAGNFFLMPYAEAGLIETQLSIAEIQQVIAGLNAEHFHRCLVSTADGWEGELFDWYICPYRRQRRASKRTGLSLKLVIEASGRVRIFSLHWSKVPK
jgi:hypothetical protein